jgi:hypothetical protein
MAILSPKVIKVKSYSFINYKTRSKVLIKFSAVDAQQKEESLLLNIEDHCYILVSVVKKIYEHLHATHSVSEIYEHLHATHSVSEIYEHLHATHSVSEISGTKVHTMFLLPSLTY